MESPKIVDCLIPRLHALSQRLELSMGTLLNLIVTEGVEKLEQIEGWDEVFTFQPIKLVVRPEEVR